jgi:Xaa-Pro aminopeptidase
MSEIHAARQAALHAAMAAHGVPALLITNLPNIRWLTGFTGSAGVLVAGDVMTLVTDFRYAVQAPEEAGGAARVLIARRDVWRQVERVVSEQDIAELGIEAHMLTLRDESRLRNLLSAVLKPLTEVVETLRQVKDAHEVQAIRSAGALALDALSEVMPSIRSGERELDVAVRLEAALRSRGSEWHPFETIVASGPRAALPHARTSDRILNRGEFLLIDFGAKVSGYCSDITRTLVLGRADPLQREIYELVETAQRRAREQVHGGMTGREADALARDLIAQHGYGEAFGHSLGHGLGLEVHEAPRLAATSEAIVPAGAVVTIEPGIYLPGWGGVRIEDDVWLKPGGPELLTDGRTGLIELDV